MRFLRSLLFALFLLILTPPYAVMCMLSFPFLHAHKRFAMVRLWTHLAIGAARWLCGIRYTFKGWENFTPMMNQPVVLLSKHQSAWETLAFVALMPKPLCFVFKRELLMIPFFGWTLGMLKMVHIDRHAGRHAFTSVIKQGKARLADGSWVIMFPEGTRTRSGTQGQYKSGGARFAIETDAWVVPIAHNAGRVWPRNTFTKTPGLITISVGPAIASQGKTPDALNREVEAWIEAEMRVIDPESYRS